MEERIGKVYGRVWLQTQGLDVVTVHRQVVATCARAISLTIQEINMCECQAGMFNAKRTGLGWQTVVAR